MSPTKLLVLVSLGLLLLLSLLVISCQRSASVAPRTELASTSGCSSAALSFDSTKNATPPWLPPSDINGGAASATLQDASLFAWQEFIALNWPAVNQTGQVNTRDVPDSTAIFGS